jgi:O-antigen/teichoic acid export membrane protein
MNTPDPRLAEQEPRKKSLAGSVISGGKWLGMAALAQALLQIVVVAVLGRLLSPGEFGLAAIAGIVIDLAAGLAVMGTSQAVVQRPDLTDHHIRAAFWISMVMGISVTLVLFFTSTWLARILGDAAAGPLIAALSVSFAIGAVASVSEGLAARRLKFRVLAVRKVAAYLLGYGAVGIVSAKLGAGAWALVYAQLAQASLESLLLVVAVRFDWRPTLMWSAYRDILGYGSGYSVAQVINSVANQLDRAIVAKSTNTVAVGLYTRAVQITRYPHRMIGQVIEDVLFPSFAGVQSDREHLKAAFYRSIGSIFVVMTPVSVFFSLAARPITNLLLGPQWGEAVVLIAAFGVSIPFRSAQRVSSALLRAVGHSWLIALLQIFFVITTGIGAIVGIRYGLLGAAIGVTIAFVLYYLAYVLACVLILSLSPRKLLLSHFAGLPLAALTACGALLGTATINILPSLISLVLALLMSILLALIAIWARPRFFLGLDGQWLILLLIAKIPVKWRSSSIASFLLKRITKDAGSSSS